MIDDFPIRLHRRRVGCANRLFEVFLDDIEEANGKTVTDFLVLAPRARTEYLITGTAILPIVNGGIALLRVFRHPLRRWCWEVPRGFIDAGETPASGALRELQEETGFCCAPADLVDLGVVAPEPGIIAGYTKLFAADSCWLPADRTFGSREMGHGELRIIAADDMSHMVAGGEIEDANTLVAWYRWRDRRAGPAHATPGPGTPDSAL